MDFFDTLSIDVKVLVVCAVGAALLAVFTGDRKREKQYILVLAIVAMVAIFRFNQTQQAPEQAATRVESPATARS